MARAANRLSYAGHLVLSACWLGAVVAYLALAVVGITAHDSEVIRAAYRAMELIGTWVIVPSSVATVVTGMVKSSDTRWGFMRRWWVVAELGLSITGVGVLLRHMTAVRMLADAVQAPAFTAEALVLPRVQLLVHAIGGP